MKELTPVSIWAKGGGVELNAELCFVVGRKMHFLEEFVISMSEGALILELAFSKQFPIPAHFSLVLYLILLHKVLSFLF